MIETAVTCLVLWLAWRYVRRARFHCRNPFCNTWVVFPGRGRPDPELTAKADAWLEEHYRKEHPPLFS